jgi:hypothetical protein
MMESRFIPIAELVDGIIPNPPDMVAVLQAYLDETGLNASAKRLTVAGFIGGKLDWADLEPRWSRTLPQRGEMFHARQCITGHKPYQAMGEPERHKLYGRLSDVIARRPFKIVSASVDMDAWKEKRRDEQFEARYPSAYSFCFDLCLLNINAYGQEREREVSVTYAISDAYQKRAEAVSEAFVASERYSKWIVGCAPNRPQRIVPLQAADMVCYEIYSQNQETKLDIGPEHLVINKLYPKGAIGLYHDAESLDEVIRRGPSGMIR